MIAIRCADCGDVLPIDQLSWFFARPLCTICAHVERNFSKKAAEIRILDHMLGDPASADASDPPVASPGNPSTREQRSS